jgi:hypothetical protein
MAVSMPQRGAQPSHPRPALPVTHDLLPADMTNDVLIGGTSRRVTLHSAQPVCEFIAQLPGMASRAKVPFVCDANGREAGQSVLPASLADAPCLSLPDLMLMA